MFWTLICPSSGACDYSVELPHWWYGSWFDVLEFWCGWVGVVSVLQAEHRYHSNPITPKLQHTSNQEKYDQHGNSTE